PGGPRALGSAGTTTSGGTVRLQGWHIIVLIVVIVLVFGANRLPDLARSVGQSLKILKSEVKDLTEDDKPAGGSATPGSTPGSTTTGSPTPGSSTPGSATPGSSTSGSTTPTEGDTGPRA